VSHFPGEHGLASFTGAKDGGGGGDNWSYKTCKAPVKSVPPTNQHPVFFTGRMPSLAPNQQCQSTEGKTEAMKDRQCRKCSKTTNTRLPSWTI